MVIYALVIVTFYLIAAWYAVRAVVERMAGRRADEVTYNAVLAVGAATVMLLITRQ